MGETRGHEVSEPSRRLDCTNAHRVTLPEGRQGRCFGRAIRVPRADSPIQLQEAVLSAFSSLTKDNEPLAMRLARAPPGQERKYQLLPRVRMSSSPWDVAVLSVVLSLCKSRNMDLQLAASLW